MSLASRVHEVPACDRQMTGAGTAATRPFVSIHGLHKRYGKGASILEDVSLEASPGDFISLIGPSGCGKSTMLKLVAGLLTPTGGTVQVDGMTPANARQLMSFIFQEATLLPWRPVIRNVELGLELEQSMDRSRRRTAAVGLLRLVGLEDVAWHYPRQLSGGMRMRVSIARALACCLRVSLADCLPGIVWDGLLSR